jgi:uncharacterized RDD family membrane protein YckC
MAGPARPAGFWIRAVAAAIDVAVFMVVHASYRLVAARFFGVAAADAWTLAPMLSAFTFLFMGAYTTLLHALGGQTIGKMLVHVRVVAMDGEPPLLGAAFLRWVAGFVSLVPFGLGYLMAGLRADKRALHDLVAGTRVERVPRAGRETAEVVVEPAEEVVPPVA